MNSPNPLQPLRDAVRDRLKALGGWQGLDDAHIMLGLDMVSDYVTNLEAENAQLTQARTICSFCLEEMPPDVSEVRDIRRKLSEQDKRRRDWQAQHPRLEPVRNNPYGDESRLIEGRG